MDLLHYQALLEPDWCFESAVSRTLPQTFKSEYLRDCFRYL